MKHSLRAEEYLNRAVQLLQEIASDEQKPFETASELIANSLIQGGMLHAFGTGHSHALVEEITRRAGGLIPVNAILDINYTLLGGPPSHSRRLERLEGYASILFEGYDLRPKEVLIIISQSGINPGPIEAALIAKRLGLYVVAVTSLKQSSSETSRHSSGKRLFELADVVLDSHVPVGDAAIELRPDLPKISPLSTVASAAILQALIAEVGARLIQGNMEPPIWSSGNVPGGDERNRLIVTKYQTRFKPI